MVRGKFITIEGQDGAGKSTNIEVMRSCLDAKGIDYVLSREPGGTKFGETVRELLLGSGDESIGNKAELLLIFAARAQHIQEIIEPALSEGKWVLCDRFTDATYAYQGFGRGLSLDDISLLEQNVQGDLRPDLTVLLDLPIEVGESRAGQRSAPDRFELQKSAFKQKVRDGYLQVADQHPERIKVVDASLPLNEVRSLIIDTLNDFLSEHA